MKEKGPLEKASINFRIGLHIAASWICDLPIFLQILFAQDGILETDEESRSGKIVKVGGRKVLFKDGSLIFPNKPHILIPQRKES